jgi:hypothetical protein
MPTSGRTEGVPVPGWVLTSAARHRVTPGERMTTADQSG